MYDYIYSHMKNILPSLKTIIFLLIYICISWYKINFFCVMFNLEKGEERRKKFIQNWMLEK